MKKTKFTESQIIGILKEQDQGKKVVDICREHGRAGILKKKPLKREL